MHSIIFRYKVIGVQRLPIVPITLFGRHENRQTEAYVDSGAIYSIFGIHLAEEIGLDPIQGRRQLFRVGDGNTIKGYVFRIPVQVGDYKFRADIAFSDELKVGFNLLGRRGIFEAFDEVIFREKHREIEFRIELKG